MEIIDEETKDEESLPSVLRYPLSTHFIEAIFQVKVVIT